MIHGNGGKAAVASYPTQSAQTACPKARTQTHRAHPIPLRAESYLIRDVLDYLDLALNGEIKFGVSAAREYKIDIDRSHAARMVVLMLLARTPILGSYSQRSDGKTPSPKQE